MYPFVKSLEVVESPQLRPNSGYCQMLTRCMAMVPKIFPDRKHSEMSVDAFGDSLDSTFAIVERSQDSMAKRRTDPPAST